MHAWLNAEMLLAEIRAVAWREKRKVKMKSVPGGGWARSTLQEVGRRNWIPARRKQQQLPWGHRYFSHHMTCTLKLPTASYRYEIFLIYTGYQDSVRWERNTTTKTSDLHILFLFDLLFNFHLIDSKKSVRICVSVSNAEILMQLTPTTNRWARFKAKSSKNVPQIYELFSMNILVDNESLITFKCTPGLFVFLWKLPIYSFLMNNSKHVKYLFLFAQ